MLRSKTVRQLRQLGGTFAALGLMALLPLRSHSQSTSMTDASQLQDIGVTAQKRSENLQDVPISITALSGADLENAGVYSVDALQHLAPGLSIAAVGSGYVSYTYIRGGGTNQQDPGSDPSVAYYVDEVYLGGSAGLQFDLFDIDHIEVLKGPQGTLFGRNAASGAISITTKQPSTSFEGSLEADLGNYDESRVKGSLSGPIASSENWLYRVSFIYDRAQ